jgi:hypothetical protein
MKIRVECYAGYRGEEEPRAFHLGQRRFDVVEVLDRWLDPLHRYFKVSTQDGSKYILRHDTASGNWELAALVGPEPSRARDGQTLH